MHSPLLPHDAPLHDRYPMDALEEAWRSLSAPRHVQCVGVDGAFEAAVLADFLRRTQRPMVLIVPTAKRARTLTTDLQLFLHEQPALPEEGGEGEEEGDLESPLMSWEVAHYPEYDLSPYHEASHDRLTTLARLTTLHRLARGLRPPRLIVTSPGALMQKTLPTSAMERMTHVWAVGDVLTNVGLRQTMMHCGFLEVPVVEDPGTFAVRGDIVDIFSPLHPQPVRLERWGDEIAEIRLFHADTQRTLGELKECVVFPVRQEVLDEQAKTLAAKRLHPLGHARGMTATAVATTLADLRAGQHILGIEALLPALYEELHDLCDYLPQDTVVGLMRPTGVLVGAQELWGKRHQEALQTARDASLFYPPESYYRSPEQLVAWVASCQGRVDFQGVTITPDTGQLHFEPAKEVHTFAFRAQKNEDIVRLRKEAHGVEQAIKRLGPLFEEWKGRYGRICFACRTQGQVERLERLLHTFEIHDDVRVMPLPIDLAPSGAESMHVEIYHAPLSQGFRSQMLGLCVIAGPEIFGARVATKPKRAVQSFSDQVAISHFRELSMGDLVVHVDHGIGQYRGLVHLVLEGVGNDFLHLEYAEGKRLYLPIYRLGRVQRYIGSAEGMRLDRLGTNTWEKTKERVKANIRELAADLLALYAKREMAKGFAFSPPDDLYREFEEQFPYEETPDQARAIEETLQDMMSPRPMDRLICGDVGFGKTEVAIRATMKAVLDKKQVAVLVPTTILAEQHLISFRQRLADHGVTVECLNRFRSTKEASDIIERTREGKIDVLIGTHRLLGDQVDYKDLGLLVVDEEQRFGVKHKDKIKKMRTNVDVLTLSATPIPRTLQMSMLGIRDLTIISTPPHSRLAVRTHVAKMSDGLIREAVGRELERGGQVFFVHNRVATIEEMAQHLDELIPQARIGVGHGQMGESKLEKVMMRYLKGEINVLLCSSIIESGLDIPNANTILINRADKFGLSQLYQLRGRVGRGSERAYAYLLVPSRSGLKQDAEKRLEVIETHTDLGSGFHVASYDLEIRGAGNLLSDDQSGHVTAVGLDLYNELLEEAVNDLRGKQSDEGPEPEVNIPVESFIPEDYIPATNLRLVFYKRFSLARSQEELDVLFEELVDRFGSAPPSVHQLRQIVAIKIACRALRVSKLDAGPSAISLDIGQGTPLLPQEVLGMVQRAGRRMSLTSEMKLVLHLKPDEAAAPLKTAKRLLDTLLSTLP